MEFSSGSKWLPLARQQPTPSLIFTDHVRVAREGNVFTGICFSVSHPPARSGQGRGAEAGSPNQVTLPPSPARSGLA